MQLDCIKEVVANNLEWKSCCDMITTDEKPIVMKMEWFVGGDFSLVFGNQQLMQK